MKTLCLHLTDEELKNRFDEGVRILIKVGRFSEKSDAEDFINNGIANKDREIFNFFTSYRREKAPLYKLLKNAKSVHSSMPINSKITFKI